MLILRHGRLSGCPTAHCQDWPAKKPNKGTSTNTLCLSRETLAIVNNLGLSVGQRNDVDTIISTIKHHINGQINESVNHHNLRSCRQQTGESFDNFFVALRELIKTCNFCSNQCAQKNIRDQIIEGLIDKDIVEHLLRQ